MSSGGKALFAWSALIAVPPVLAFFYGWEAFFPVACMSIVGAAICLAQNAFTKDLIEQIKGRPLKEVAAPSASQSRINFRKQVQRVEVWALFICTALLFCVLVHNTEIGGSRCPTTFLLMADTNGICRLHGVPLANSFLRRATFQVMALSGAEVEISLFPGWARNPTIKSNVCAVAEDVERFGLSAGDRAVARRSNRMP